MSKNKHTPGPWIIETNAETPNTFRVRANFSFRKHISTEESVCITGSEGNARLIAAAPEMLVVLEAVFKNIMAGEQIPSSWITKTRDVIAKAKGGAK